MCNWFKIRVWEKPFLLVSIIQRNAAQCVVVVVAIWRDIKSTGDDVNEWEREKRSVSVCLCMCIEWVTGYSQCLSIKIHEFSFSFRFILFAQRQNNKYIYFLSISNYMWRIDSSSVKRRTKHSLTNTLSIQFRDIHTDTHTETCTHVHIYLPAVFIFNSKLCPIFICLFRLI